MKKPSNLDPKFFDLILKIRKAASLQTIRKRLNYIAKTDPELTNMISETTLEILEKENLSPKEQKNFNFVKNFLASNPELPINEKLLKDYFQLDTKQIELLPEKISQIPHEKISEFFQIVRKYFDFKKEKEFCLVLSLMVRVLRILDEKGIFSLPLWLSIDQTLNLMGTQASLVYPQYHQVAIVFPEYLSEETNEYIKELMNSYLNYASVIEEQLKTILRKNLERFTQTMMELVSEKFDFNYLTSFFLLLDKTLVKENLYIEYTRYVSNLLFSKKYHGAAKKALGLDDSSNPSLISLREKDDVPVFLRSAYTIFEKIIDKYDHAWLALRRILYHASGSILFEYLKSLCLNPLHLKNRKLDSDYEFGISIVEALIASIKSEILTKKFIEFINKSEIISNPNNIYYPAKTDPKTEKNFYFECNACKNKESLEIVLIPSFDFENIKLNNDILIFTKTEIVDFNHFTKKTLLEKKQGVESFSQFTKTIKKLEVPLAEFAKQLISEIVDYSFRQVKEEELFLVDVEVTTAIEIIGIRFRNILSSTIKKVQETNKKAKILTELDYCVGFYYKLADEISYDENCNLIYENIYQLLGRTLALCYLHEQCVPDFATKSKIPKKRKNLAEISKDQTENKPKTKQKLVRIKRRIIALYHEEYSDKPQSTIEVEYDEDGEPKGTRNCPYWRRLPWGHKMTQKQKRNWENDPRRKPYPKTKPEWIYPDAAPFKFTWIRESKPRRIAKNKPEGFYPEEGYVLLKANAASRQLQTIFQKKKQVKTNII